MAKPVIICATRKTPLAKKQTQLAVDYLKPRLPDYDFELLELETSGDRQQAWSLELQGGKGLFTKELEEALLAKKAHIAVHSAKDLPTHLPQGLFIAGYLPREDPLDVWVCRQGVKCINVIATGSPRRKAQLQAMYPEAAYIEIRGAIQTRLKKIQDGYADATVVAAAGLKRLGIEAVEGLELIPLDSKSMVPAVGQGAIALEVGKDYHDLLEPLMDVATFESVTIERTYLRLLGGGCHAAYAAYHKDDKVKLFHHRYGYQETDFKYTSLEALEHQVQGLIEQLETN